MGIVEEQHELFLPPGADVLIFGEAEVGIAAKALSGFSGGIPLLVCVVVTEQVCDLVEVQDECRMLVQRHRTFPYSFCGLEQAVDDSNRIATVLGQ